MLCEHPQQGRDTAESLRWDVPVVTFPCAHFSPSWSRGAGGGWEVFRVLRPASPCGRASRAACAASPSACVLLLES